MMEPRLRVPGLSAPEPRDLLVDNKSPLTYLSNSNLFLLCSRSCVNFSVMSCEARGNVSNKIISNVFPMYVEGATRVARTATSGAILRRAETFLTCSPHQRTSTNPLGQVTTYLDLLRVVHVFESELILVVKGQLIYLVF